MKGILKRTVTSVAVAAVLASPLAQATNGYFKIGYGSKNRGMAGAGMAYGQDSLAPAVNPATLAGIGNRVDAGAEIFNPDREGALDATAIGGANSEENSDANHFFIPNFGIARELNSKMTVGISMVANGGMNTRYGDPDAGNGNIYTDAFAPAIPGFVNNLIGAGFDPNIVGGNAQALALNPNISPSLGVNLGQVLIAPTLAYKITKNHSIGIAPVIGYQWFRAYGLGLFQAFSSDPGKVTNNGNDDAFGLGGRVGYQGTIGMFSIGASYTSKIYMQEFSKYEGLFAEQGDFDIPSTYGVGLAIRPTSNLTIAADVTRINYSDTAAINNAGPTADQFFSAMSAALTNGDPTSPFTVSNPLGTNNGWGFGWDDVTVYKVGVSYDLNSQWTVRAGYNYAESPYDDDQTLFNILAPGLVEQHYTVGFTYSPNASNEFTMTYMHAFRNDQEYTYTGSAGGPFAGFSYSAKNAMSQNALEASYSWKF